MAGHTHTLCLVCKGTVTEDKQQMCGCGMTRKHLYYRIPDEFICVSEGAVGKCKSNYPKTVAGAEEDHVRQQPVTYQGMV